MYNIYKLENIYFGPRAN